MEFHPYKAFFKSDTVDPFTGLPVYVFDSNYLPNLTNTDKKTFEHLMVKAFKRIISRIPSHPYVLVCYTSGFKNFNNSNHSWVTALKCYQLLPNELKSNMKKAFIVHESWLVRSFTQILQNVFNNKLFKPNSQGFDRLVYCKDLTELSKFIDITKIRTSLAVYLYDTQFAERLIIPYTARKSSNDHLQYLDLINDRVLARLLLEGKSHELVFTKPGNPKKMNILLEAIDRGNYLDISQWDIYSVATFYLNNTLKGFEEPLIPISEIPLPIKDDLNYTLNTFDNINKRHDSFELLARFFEIILTLLESSESTKHTIKSITKAITPALCHEKVSLKNNDRLLIGQRFIKNLLENWFEISKRYSNPQEERYSQPLAPPSRKVSISTQKVLEVKKRQPRSLPDVPEKIISRRNPSTSSVLSMESAVSNSSHEAAETLELPEETTSITEVDTNGSKVLSDVTISLNRLSQDPLKTRKKGKVLMKFSEGYSSMEGQRKVSKLAKLYEERLMGVQLINEMDK